MSDELESAAAALHGGDWENETSEGLKDLYRAWAAEDLGYADFFDRDAAVSRAVDGALKVAYPKLQAELKRRFRSELDHMLRNCKKVEADDGSFV